MSAKNMVWMSMLTLVVLVGTLGVVWNTRQQLAHTETEAAYSGPTLSDREKYCKDNGGTWSVTLDNPDGGRCAKGDYIYIHDGEGRLTQIK